MCQRFYVFLGLVCVCVFTVQALYNVFMVLNISTPIEWSCKVHYDLD